MRATNLGTIFVMISLLMIGLLNSSVVAEDSIKIASIYAHTGRAADGNLTSVRGVQLAVEEVNKNGGVLGRTLQLIELDNQSTAIGAKQAAEQAIAAGVVAVIGAGWSSHSIAMAPTLQEAGIPMITDISTNPKVTLIGDYIFRVCFIDPFQGKVAAQFALKDLKADRAVILTNLDSDYSLDLSTVFKDWYVKNGGEVVWESEYRGKEVEFTDLLNKIQALKPKVVFVPGQTQDSAFIMKQAKNLGIEIPFLGGDGWGSRIFEYGGADIDGNYLVGHWNRQVDNPKTRHLAKLFEQKFNEDLASDGTPLAYDATHLLVSAIERAKSTDRKKLRDAIASTPGFEGATGTIRFDDNGDPVDKNAVILQLKEPKREFVKVITLE